MQLTPQELAMVAVLKRQRDTWPVLRGGMTILSLALILSAISEFSSSGWGAVPLVLLIVGAGTASHVYRNWRGPIEATLLLKLLETQNHGPSA